MLQHLSRLSRLSRVRGFFFALALPSITAGAVACARVTDTRGDTRGDAPQSSSSSATPPAESSGTNPDPPAALRSDWQARAAGYLDGRAAGWLASPPNVGNIKCAMSCHTTLPYLMARSALAPFAPTPAAEDTRARLDARVAEAVAGTAIPMYGHDNDAKVKESQATEAVLDAAALALDELASGAALRDATKTALDRMWAQQRADGAWDWLEFNLEPWETRDDWGAALAALVAGSVPPDASPAQAAGTAKLVEYVQKRLAATSAPMALHDRAMLLWASHALATLLTPAEAEAIAAELAATQREDGGFALAAWGRGALADATEKQSDGYATALAVLALCHGTPMGVTRDDVKRGLGWLAQSQAEDGSWPGRSVNGESPLTRGFMTDAATAYATLALTTCK